MSVDKRYSKSSSRCCVVIGCNNSSKKRFLWDSENCTKHIGKIRMFCKCPRPFGLFTFPTEKSDESKLRRMTWIENINRNRNNFKPYKSAVVSSSHKSKLSQNVYVSTYIRMYAFTDTMYIITINDFCSGCACNLIITFYVYFLIYRSAAVTLSMGNQQRRIHPLNSIWNLVRKLSSPERQRKRKLQAC